MPLQHPKCSLGEDGFQNEGIRKKEEHRINNAKSEYKLLRLPNEFKCEIIDFLRGKVQLVTKIDLLSRGLEDKKYNTYSKRRIQRIFRKLHGN